MSVKKLERLLKKAADSQQLIHDDALSRVVEQSEETELSEEELDMVSAAAAQPDFNRFLEYAKRKKKK